MKSFEFEVNNPRNVIREELFILQIVERVLAGFLTSVTSVDQSLYCEILTKRQRNKLPIQPLHLEIMHLISSYLESNNIPIKEEKVPYKIKTVSTQRIKQITKNQLLTTREQQTTENHTKLSSPKHSIGGKYIVLGKQPKSRKIDNYPYLNKSESHTTAKKQTINQFQLINSNSSQLETNNTKDYQKILPQTELNEWRTSQRISKFDSLINEKTNSIQHSQQVEKKEIVVKQPPQTIPYIDAQQQQFKDEIPQYERNPMDIKLHRDVKQQPSQGSAFNQNMKQEAPQKLNVTKEGINSSQLNVAVKHQIKEVEEYQGSNNLKPNDVQDVNQKQQSSSFQIPVPQKAQQNLQITEKKHEYQKEQKNFSITQNQKQYAQITPKQEQTSHLDETNFEFNFTQHDENYFSPQNTTQKDQQKAPSIAKLEIKKQESEVTNSQQKQKSNIFIFPPQLEEQGLDEKINQEIPMTQSLKFQENQTESQSIAIHNKQQSLIQIPNDEEFFQNRKTSIQQMNIQISKCTFDETSEQTIQQELLPEQLKSQSNFTTFPTHIFQERKNNDFGVHESEEDRRLSSQFFPSNTYIHQQTPTTLQINQFNDHHVKQFKSSQNIVVPDRTQQKYTKQKNEKSSNRQRDQTSYQKSEDSQPSSKQNIEILQGERQIKSKNVKKQKQLQLPINNFPNSVRRKSSNIIQQFDVLFIFIKAKKHEQQEKERKRQSEYLKLLEQIKAEKEFMEQFTMPENMSLNQKKGVIEHLISQLENNTDQDLKYQIMLYKQRQEQISQLAKQELIFNSSQIPCYNEIEQLAEQKIKCLNKDDFQKTNLMKFGNQVQTVFTNGSKQINQEADSPLKRDFRVLSKLHPIEIERQINRINEFKQESELIKFFRSFNSLYDKQVIQCDLDHRTQMESPGSAKPGTGYLSTAATRRKLNIGKTAKLGITMRRIKQNIQKRFKTQESTQQ